VELAPEIGMKEADQRKQHIGSHYARDRILRRSLGLRLDKRPIPDIMRPISLHRLAPTGMTNEGQPLFAESRMSVGPLHRGRQRKRGDGEKGAPGSDTAGPGESQRSQPSAANLGRVNEAVRRSGQTRFMALLQRVDATALEKEFGQRSAAGPGSDPVKVEDYKGILRSISSVCTPRSTAASTALSQCLHSES
jgi:hypothetical protein